MEKILLVDPDLFIGQLTHKAFKGKRIVMVGKNKKDWEVVNCVKRKRE